MQFQIPQFIENETLLLGPLTVTQSVYIGGSVIGAIIIHVMLGGGVIAWLLSILLVFFALSFSFVKIQGRPLPKVMTNFISFFNSSKIYLWEMKFIPPKILKIKKEKKEIGEKQKYTLSKDIEHNRLRDLFFELNIKKKEDE